jgi:hypothetical protein
MARVNNETHFTVTGLAWLHPFTLVDVTKAADCTTKLLLAETSLESDASCMNMNLYHHSNDL